MSFLAFSLLKQVHIHKQIRIMKIMLPIKKTMTPTKELFTTAEHPNSLGPSHGSYMAKHLLLSTHHEQEQLPSILLLKQSSFVCMILQPEDVLDCLRFVAQAKGEVTVRTETQSSNSSTFSILLGVKNGSDWGTTRFELMLQIKFTMVLRLF